jgi:hypothetical protein
MNEFLSSDAGGLVAQVAIAAIGAAFAALTGSKMYEDSTNRRQRFFVNLIANAVAHTYANYVRPTKTTPEGDVRPMSIREKSTAEDIAIQFVYDKAKAHGVDLPKEKVQEIRAEIVREVARVKSAVRTSPGTKGG